MRKSFLLTLLCFVLLPPISARGQEQFSRPVSQVSGIACEQPKTETLILKHIVCNSQCVARAYKKAQLSELLRQSLYDDAEGIVNVQRNKEIKKLLNELRR